MENNAIGRVFHSPTRKRGAGYAGSLDDANQSLAYASGWDANPTCNFRTYASGYENTANRVRSP